MGRYLAGVILLLVALVPLHYRVVSVARPFAQPMEGAPARLAEMVTDLTVFILVSQVLGSIHLYRIAPMVIALAAVGWRLGCSSPNLGAAMAGRCRPSPRDNWSNL